MSRWRFWCLKMRILFKLWKFNTKVGIYLWLQRRWNREPHLRRLRKLARIPLRYHLMAFRSHLRYRLLMALWRLRRPLLLFDDRIWWAMALTESVEYRGRAWSAGAFITLDDRVIVSHRRGRMERMAQDHGFRLVHLSALPPRYILWEDWVSPAMR